MKIPFEDSRSGMKKRWTDIRKMNQTRFFEVYDFIDNCNDFSSEEFLKLRALINKKADVLMHEKNMV